MNKFKIYFIILSCFFILFNAASETIFEINGLMIHEIFIVLSFIIISPKINFHINKLDIAFFIFFISAIIIPILANPGASYSDSLKILLPIKIWLVYRITLYLLKNHKKYNQLLSKISSIIKIIIHVSIIAGFIGIMRIFSPDSIRSFINTIWPIKERIIRLSSTVSGVNGTGIFFSILSFYSLYIYETENRIKYLFITFYFVLIIILTGSFTGFGTFIVFFFYKYRKIIKKLIIKIILFIILFTFVVSKISSVSIFIKKLIKQRVESKIYNQGGEIRLIPSNLSGRAERWPVQLSILRDRPIFGYGANIPVEEISELTTSTNAHNYYVYLLMQGGILGFLGYLYFIFVLIRTIFKINISNNKRYFNHKKYLLLSVIFIGLLAQITSLTFQYGGYSELFGINMAFITLLAKYDY